MSLSLKIYDEAKKFDAKNKSLLGKSNGFTVALCKNAFWTYNSDYWRLNTFGFEGIMLEDLALSFQTNWGDAGGAVIGKKIESFVNSKFVKFLAGQSEHGFSPFICSDAWTQQKVNGEATPVKLQLKFKAYNVDRMGCTNYNDIIGFLIHICSPLKSSSLNNSPSGRGGLGDDIGNTLNDSMAGVGELATTFKEGAKAFTNSMSDDSNNEGTLTTAAATLVNTVNDISNKLINNTSNGKNNANFTVNFALGNRVFDRKIHSEVMNPGETQNETITVDSPLDWIITNFSFRPSRQFTFSENESDKDFGLPKPLWVDFDMSLETRLSLSNRYVYNVIVPNELKITTGLKP